MSKTIFIIRQKVSSDPRYGISRMSRTWDFEFDTEEEARDFVEESGNDSTDPCFEYIETERDYTDEERSLDRADYLYDSWKDEHM
jgi:hypothetical protein